MTTVLEPETTIAPEPLVPVIPEVERAALWLDEHAPGWYRHIAIHALVIANCQLCVAGQLLRNMGCPEYVREELRMFSARMGFDEIWDFEAEDEAVCRVEYAALQDAWEHEIARRREDG